MTKSPPMLTTGPIRSFNGVVEAIQGLGEGRFASG